MRQKLKNSKSQIHAGNDSMEYVFLLQMIIGKCPSTHDFCTTYNLKSYKFEGAESEKIEYFP